MRKQEHSHRSTHKQFLDMKERFPQATSWTPVYQTFLWEKSLCNISKVFLPKRLPEKKKKKSLHKALKGFIAGLSYGCCSEHPEEPTPILAGLLGCATSSGEMVTFPRPQDWGFLPHWNAAVTPERSSSWPHLLREGPKRRTDPSVLLLPSLRCNTSLTPTGMWMYNEYKAAA